jgi:hypothetical protein
VSKEPARNPDLHGNAPDKSPVALLMIDVINALDFEHSEQLLEQALPMARRIAALKRRAEEAGRDPIPITLSGAKPDLELIERGEEAGVHRCTFYISPADAGETERQLDELASTLGVA